MEQGCAATLAASHVLGRQPHTPACKSSTVVIGIRKGRQNYLVVFLAVGVVAWGLVEERRRSSRCSRLRFLAGVTIAAGQTLASSGPAAASDRAQVREGLMGMLLP